jgi:hypothetical protein
MLRPLDWTPARAIVLSIGRSLRHRGRVRSPSQTGAGAVRYGNAGPWLGTGAQSSPGLIVVGEATIGFAERALVTIGAPKP